MSIPAMSKGALKQQLRTLLARYEAADAYYRPALAPWIRIMLRRWRGQEDK